MHMYAYVCVFTLPLKSQSLTCPIIAKNSCFKVFFKIQGKLEIHKKTFYSRASLTVSDWCNRENENTN